MKSQEIIKRRAKGKKRGSSSKALVLVIVLVAVFAAAVTAVFWRTRDTGPQGYVFEKNYGVKFADAVKARGMLAGSEAQGVTAGVSPAAGINLHDFFTKDFAANPFTLKFFRYITQLFSGCKTRAEALKKARDYIFSQLPPAEAEKVYALYVKFIDSEVALVNAQKNWGNPKTPDEVIALLRKAQDLRREQLGAETADALFGPEVKIKEYQVRRGAIVGDTSLYGAEKEKRIAQLTQDMWGNEAAQVEDYGNSYNRYQEKRAIYQKDLDEQPSDAARAAKDQQFRQEFFNPHQVTALNNVDAQLAAEQKAEDSFKAARAQVENDQTLTPEQQQQKIKDLGVQMLGQENADALSRREAIEKGKEDLMKSHGK
jgi:lipase chaperone LimK